MSQERPQPPTQPRSTDEFGFTECEQLFDRISHERLLRFLDETTTTVHRIEASHNNYGEFLFITASRPGKDRRILVTFWGAGYHEYRERWLIDEWNWYHANPFPDTLKQHIPTDEAKALVRQRLEEIGPYAARSAQSARGKLFEMLADLTDEDGALAELEDLGDLADWLADDSE